MENNMSCELFDIEDHTGTSIMLEMNVHGTLFLTVLGPEGGRNEYEPDDMVTFTFHSNDDGIACVKSLCCALTDWIEHVEENNE